MNKELVIELVNVWKGHGTYEIIKKKYSSKDVQKEKYLLIFENYIEKNYSRNDICEKLDDENMDKEEMVLADPSDINRIVNSVGKELLILDLENIISGQSEHSLVIPDCLITCTANLELKACKLLYLLVEVQEIYLGCLEYVPSEILKPLFNTRNVDRIDVVIQQLKNLSISPNVYVFEHIEYKKGKIKYMFSNIISHTIQMAKIFDDIEKSI